MSYIPDLRSEENEAHLNAADQNYLAGYRHAIEDAKNFFFNLDIYGREGLEDLSADFDDWMDMEEEETVCSIFDNADYIPEDIDIKDVRPSPYANL